MEICLVKPDLKKHSSDRTANVKIYFVEYALFACMFLFFFVLFLYKNGTP